MRNIISHIVAGRILGVSVERLGGAIALYEDLVEISNNTYEMLSSRNPEVERALNSEGSTFLKAALICQCIVLFFGRSLEPSEESLIKVAACASTSSSYFLSLLEDGELEDEHLHQEKLLLVSLVNKFAKSDSEQITMASSREV